MMTIEDKAREIAEMFATKTQTCDFGGKWFTVSSAEDCYCSAKQMAYWLLKELSEEERKKQKWEFHWYNDKL